MSKRIEIRTQTLSTNISIIQAQLDAIEADMETMYAAVKHLDTMWDGPANKAFNEQFGYDHADMKELCKTIQKIIDCFTYAKTEYDKCEVEVASIVNSIRIN